MAGELDAIFLCLFGGGSHFGVGVGHHLGKARSHPVVAGEIDFDRINRELTECHCQVLKKSPFAYLRVLDGFDEAMTLLAKTHESDTRWAYLLHDTHSKLSSRIDFYRKKLHGQEYYQSITLQDWRFSGVR